MTLNNQLIAIVLVAACLLLGAHLDQPYPYGDDIGPAQLADAQDWEAQRQAEQLEALERTRAAYAKGLRDGARGMQEALHGQHTLQASQALLALNKGGAQ